MKVDRAGNSNESKKNRAENDRENVMNKKEQIQQGGEVSVRSGHVREVAREAIAPAIDICETDTGWLLVADMPGVPKENIDVQVERGVLTISGRAQSEPPAGRIIYQGFQRADYFRTVALSDEVDRAKITASQNGGVLTVVLPKAAAAQTRRITVQSG